jgi:propanediol dehydratase small subunit
MDFDPVRDYPLGTKRADLVTTPSGIPLAGVTVEALRAGLISADDMRATAETLRRQAAVALAAGRAQLADNLERAAELASVPGEVILEIYTALRPHRSTATELGEWADRLESSYGAGLTAAFVRQAGSVYSARGLLAPEA